jgi:hypothetical protein
MDCSKRRNALWLLVLLFGLNVFSAYSASVQQFCHSDQGKITYENPFDDSNNFFLRTSEKESTVSRLQEDFSAIVTPHTDSAVCKSLQVPFALKEYQPHFSHQFYIKYRRLLI